MIALCALAFPMLALRAPVCCAFVNIVRILLVNVVDIAGCAGPCFLLACCEHSVLVQFVVDMCVLVVLEPMPAARANAHH
jgi:hypothetical protein